MPLNAYTPEEVAAAIARSEGAAKRLAAKKGRVDASLIKLTGRSRDLEGEIRTEQRNLEDLRAARLLLVPFPPDVERLRAHIIEARIDVQDVEISVRRAGELRATIKRLETELIAACPHPIVLNAEEYKACSSGDDDRSEPGERTCAVCNLHEYQYARYGGEGGFKALVEADHRLFGQVNLSEMAARRAAFLLMKERREIVAAFTSKRLITLLEEARSAPTK